jgi:hypothetical protein
VAAETRQDRASWRNSILRTAAASASLLSTDHSFASATSVLASRWASAHPIPAVQPGLAAVPAMLVRVRRTVVDRCLRSDVEIGQRRTAAASALSVCEKTLSRRPRTAAMLVRTIRTAAHHRVLDPIEPDGRFREWRYPRHVRGITPNSAGFSQLACLAALRAILRVRRRRCRCEPCSV